MSGFRFLKKKKKKKKRETLGILKNVSKRFVHLGSNMVWTLGVGDGLGVYDLPSL